jgi:hypothetical protein
MSIQPAQAETSEAQSAQAMKNEQPPEVALMQIVGGGLLQQALYVAAKLSIADLLAERPQTADELAKRTRTHARALYRVLRALASVGVFAESNGQTFQLTPPAELLRSDAPGSLRDAVIFMGEEWHWRVWADMLYSVETGKVAWAHVHGKEVFPWFAAHPEESEIFNRAMTGFSQTAASAVAEAYDFSGIKTLADIAGGHGMLLAGILKSNPQLKGVLFDLPQVIEGAGELLKREGVAERVQLATGDFFEAVPQGADAYLMKFIIHDWDDERALKILRNIHRAMPGDGKLLLAEMVVPAGNEPHFSKIQDLEMLVSPGGVERTEQEYSDLFAEAGFRLTRIIATKSPLSLIEGVKMDAGR